VCLLINSSTITSGPESEFGLKTEFSPVCLTITFSRLNSGPEYPESDMVSVEFGFKSDISVLITFSGPEYSDIGIESSDSTLILCSSSNDAITVSLVSHVASSTLKSFSQDQLTSGKESHAEFAKKNKYS
jgi:hypothetical protein